MIESIRCKNFKSWKRLDLRLEDLTALFGTNSSGKSSVLQLLLLLKQSAAATDRRQVLDLGNEDSLVELGTYEELIYNGDVNSSLEIGLSWTVPSEEAERICEQLGISLAISLSFDVTLAYTASRLIVERFTYRMGSLSVGMEKSSKGKYKFFEESAGEEAIFSQKQGKPWPLPSPDKFFGFPDRLNTAKKNTSILDDLQLSLENQLSSIHYLGPLRQTPERRYIYSGNVPSNVGKRGEKTVTALLASRKQPLIGRGKGKKKWSVEEFVADHLKQLGLIHSFRVLRLVEGEQLYKVLIKKNSTSQEVNLTDVGFGVSQVLPILTICYYADPGSTILLEQPEIHLHPLVQSELADVFLESLKLRKVQFLIESHSEHLLRRLQRRLAERSTSTNNIQLYFATNESSASKMEELKLDENGMISNWPEHFFGDEMGEIHAINEAIYGQ